MKIPRHIPEWSDEDWADWDRIAEEAGCEEIPEDDPYYTSGASFTFLSRTFAPSADKATPSTPSDTRPVIFYRPSDQK